MIENNVDTDTQLKGLRLNLLHRIAPLSAKFPYNSMSDSENTVEQASSSALIFGEVTDGKPPKHVLVTFGQEAYETFQLHRYMTLLLRIREEGVHNYLCPGFGLIWAGLEVLYGKAAAVSGEKCETACVEEMGSTLFDTIDRLDQLSICLGGTFDFKQVRFLGIEPCSLFARTAEALHPSNNIVHVQNWNELPSPAPYTLSRSYQATSYAFACVDELCDWIARSALSVHGIWFSLSGEDETITVFGKRLVFFSLDRLCEDLSERGFQVLPISSESYTLDTHSFLCVFLCVHRFEGNHLHQLQLLCQEDRFGLPYSIYSVPEDPASWVRLNVIHKGAHAGYIEMDSIEYSNPMFNFGSGEVIQQFQKNLAAVTQN